MRKLLLLVLIVSALAAGCTDRGEGTQDGYSVEYRAWVATKSIISKNMSQKASMEFEEYNPSNIEKISCNPNLYKVRGLMKAEDEARTPYIVRFVMVLEENELNFRVDDFTMVPITRGN